MERDFYLKGAYPIEFNFNSHAHVERDRFSAYFFPIWIISTHTLTWSVTKTITSSSGVPNISTHTLTWSVTWQQGLTDKNDNISTHTLTWSVTRVKQSESY